ncbi:MAG: DUF4271 domain-containing protein [Alloprevotella sp.]|nr:DUF4271 domain-containing protein [Alloprevotella sp.]
MPLPDSIRAFSDSLSHLPLMRQETTALQSLPERTDSLLRDTAAFPAIADMRQGIVAKPIPYEAVSDDLIVGSLLFSLCCMVWVLLRNTPLLSSYFRSSSLSSDASEEPHFSSFALLLLCFSLPAAVLYTIYIYRTHGHLPLALPTYVFPLLAAVGIGLAAMLKEGLCRFVDNVFFHREVVLALRVRRALFLLLVSVPLFALTTLTVTLRLPILTACYIGGSCLLVVLIWLFVSEIIVFSRTKLFFVHKILYFCTLEVAPWILLMGILATILNYSQIIITE